LSVVVLFLFHHHFYYLQKKKRGKKGKIALCVSIVGLVNGDGGVFV